MALTELLASSFAFAAVLGSTPTSWSQPASVSLASASRLADRTVLAGDAANDGQEHADADREDARAGRSPRRAPVGRRGASSESTSGEVTAAMTPAAISGITMVCVSASSEMMAAPRSTKPTSSQAVMPPSRSQSGAAHTPLSSRGSISKYCSAGAGASPSSASSPPRGASAVPGCLDSWAPP